MRRRACIEYDVVNHVRKAESVLKRVGYVSLGSRRPESRSRIDTRRYKSKKKNMKNDGRKESTRHACFASLIDELRKTSVSGA